jgi:lipopolysaccharide/colanic/teichoic acid biosynthesis glycosyltransferase
LSGPKNGASTDRKASAGALMGAGAGLGALGKSLETEKPPTPRGPVHMRHRLVLSVIDLCLIGLATICAQLLRDSFETRPEQFLALLPYLGLTLAAAIPSLALFRLNRSIWRFSGMADYLSALGAAILIVATAVGLGFLVNRLEGVARSLPIIQAHLIAFGLVGVRVAARLRHNGRGRAAARPTPAAGELENILVVGVNLITELYLRSVAEFSAGRVQVMGLLAGKERNTGRLVQRYRILGRPEQIASILGDLEVHGAPICRVVVTLPFGELSPEARAALHEAEENLRIRVEFFADYICGSERFKPAAPAVPPPGKMSADMAPTGVDAPAALARRPYWRVKRVLDVAAATCLIVLLAPLLVLVAVLVVVDVGPPALFWQLRPGVGGRPFRLYKFRTMGRPYDAEGCRIADADRLTAIGRFLRRFRLDELPQLFNILMGEMSFIGPRPLLQADQFPGLDARLAVRPGMSGWAQIKGGRELSASDKAALDVWYIKNACLRVDLEILLGTLRVVLLGERAADGDAIREAWRELRPATAGANWRASSVPHGARAQPSA